MDNRGDLGREIRVTIVRFAVVRHRVIPASQGGKSKRCCRSWRSSCIWPLLEVVADTWSAIALP